MQVCQEIGNNNNLRYWSGLFHCCNQICVCMYPAKGGRGAMFCCICDVNHIPRHINHPDVPVMSRCCYLCPSLMDLSLFVSSVISIQHTEEEGEARHWGPIHRQVSRCLHSQPNQHTHPHLRLHYILPLEIVFERSGFYNPPPRWRLQLLPNEDISHQVETFSVFLQLLIQPVAIPKLVLVEGGGGSHTNSRKCSTICILCIQPSPKNSIRCGKAKTVYLVPFLQLWTQVPSPD